MNTHMEHIYMQRRGGSGENKAEIGSTGKAPRGM
jgi:hypothetical protein